MTTGSGPYEEPQESSPPEAESSLSSSTGSSANLERDIVRTRHEIEETINEIQHRLRPERLRRQAQDAVRDTVRESAYAARDNVKESAQQTSNRMLDTIKENPIPSILTGVGLSWLFARGASSSKSNRGRAYGDYDRYESDRYGQYGREGYRETGRVIPPDESYHTRTPREQADFEKVRQAAQGESPDEGGSTGERIGEAASEAGRRARQATEEAGGRVREVADEAGQRARKTANQAGRQVRQTADQAGRAARQYGRQARHQARRAETQLERWIDENPLAVGAATLAIGAFTGLAVPSTRREDEMMGRTRDQAVHQAQERAQEAIKRGQRVVKETVEETAKETTTEAIETAMGTGEEEGKR